MITVNLLIDTSRRVVHFDPPTFRWGSDEEEVTWKIRRRPEKAYAQRARVRFVPPATTGAPGWGRGSLAVPEDAPSSDFSPVKARAADRDVDLFHTEQRDDEGRLAGCIHGVVVPSPGRRFNYVVEVETMEGSGEFEAFACVHGDPERPEPLRLAAVEGPHRRG